MSLTRLSPSRLGTDNKASVGYSEGAGHQKGHRGITPQGRRHSTPQREVTFVGSFIG